MKPTGARELEIALRMPFPWGEFKGTPLNFVPSKLLKWSAEHLDNDAQASACDLVWNHREDTGTHYEE